MSKIPLSYVELHDAFFFGGSGIGLGPKLGIHSPKHSDIELVYDREEKELLVKLKIPNKGDFEGIIPLTNVKVMVEAKPKAETVIKPVAAAPVIGKATAQVETPQSHVHAGPGHGSTGQVKGKVVL